MFPTTIWTTIHQAGEQDTVALQDVAQRYRQPVLEFIRRRGFNGNDAEDICQDVFVRVLQGRVLAKADRQRGRVVVEGMALGKAVVASRLGGPSEIITPGSGVTFDPEDPAELAMVLRQLMDDPVRRQSLGDGALERVSAFGIRENAAAVERVYQELLPERGNL